MSGCSTDYRPLPTMAAVLAIAACVIVRMILNHYREMARLKSPDDSGGNLTQGESRRT